MNKILGLVLGAILLTSGVVYGAQSSFSWTPNTEEDLAGYSIHYGETPGDYLGMQDCDMNNIVNDRVQCTLTYPNVGGVTYFAATAFDTGGQRSGYSNELSFDPAPGTPQGVMIEVTVSVQVN